jgi:hypothetical protein
VPKIEKKALSPVVELTVRGDVDWVAATGYRLDRIVPRRENAGVRRGEVRETTFSSLFRTMSGFWRMLSAQEPSALQEMGAPQPEPLGPEYPVVLQNPSTASSGLR